MKYAPAIAITAVLALAAGTAAAGSKHHPRYPRHARASAVAPPAPQSGYGPARIIEAKPGVFISTYGCITDEGYGRWLYCGQGRGL
jgi:hypothetical protein